MNRAEGGSPPDPNDPFRRSSRLSRSPTRGTGMPVLGAANPVPAARISEQAGTQPPKPSNRSAVELVNLATATNATSIITDLISVPSQKLAA